MKVLIDTGTYSEHIKVIRCDIKPGSVQRSRHGNVTIFLGVIRSEITRIYLMYEPIY
jgi:hypothetical protein